MAYSNLTSVGGVPELIDAICTFAGANGWTVHRNDLASGLRTATISIPGTTDYIHLYNTSTSDYILRARISMDYDGLLAPSAQTRVTPYDALCDIRVGPIPEVFLFANGNALHVACAISVSGQYRHISMGLLDKAGSYAGGTYYDASYHPQGNYQNLTSNGTQHTPFGSSLQGINGGFLHADCTLDSRTDYYHKFYENGPVDTGANAQWPYAGGQSIGFVGRLIKGADQNTFSGRSVFHPIRVYVKRTGTPTYMSPAGTVVGLRFASMQKFDPEQEIVIGGDTWQLFPLSRKGDESGTYYPAGTEESRSGPFGLAVLKSP